MAPRVLFIYNEHLATEGLLGEAFSECGYDSRESLPQSPPGSKPAGTSATISQWAGGLEG